MAAVPVNSDMGKRSVDDHAIAGFDVRERGFYVLAVVVVVAALPSDIFIIRTAVNFNGMDFGGRELGCDGPGIRS
jgi:hypothetical protein